MSATIRTNTGQKAGSVDPDGTIRNFTGQKIGYLDVEGKVHDRTRMVVGRVSEEGIIRRDLTHKLGQVDEDGGIHDFMGIRIGRAFWDSNEALEIEYRIDESTDATLDPTETMSETIHIVPVERATVTLAQIGAAALLLLFQTNAG